MKYLPDNIGLYIHIPFCQKKCFYCDFYSVCLNKSVYRDYLDALINQITSWSGKIDSTVDTVYIGGGTPSLLRDDILPLMSAVKTNFLVSSDAEITVECNPNLDLSFLEYAKKSGVNRLSIGVQAGSDSRLMSLGRTHTTADARRVVEAARKQGFDNISCDLMIALPESDIYTLMQDIDFICGLSPDHISAYMLKIEEKTAFYRLRNDIKLPDDDSAAGQYLTVCDSLENLGFEHYEISSFARQNKKSRHNLKYWRCEEYLGIGPSAHSFIGGKRFFYPRDIKAFIRGNEPTFDCEGGSRQEKIILRLRLSEGVEIKDFGYDISYKAEKLKSAGLVNISGDKISLTDKGMLVSNSIITELLYEDI
ncbi:MAG: radical SAM family heme chaperone HemW [Clostridia bacterium]|nr:radical SAM family heme chaperone HemW [Clostridia bacterium]